MLILRALHGLHQDALIDLGEAIVKFKHVQFVIEVVEVSFIPHVKQCRRCSPFILLVVFVKSEVSKHFKFKYLRFLVHGTPSSLVTYAHPFFTAPQWSHSVKHIR